MPEYINRVVDPVSHKEITVVVDAKDEREVEDLLRNWIETRFKESRIRFI